MEEQRKLKPVLEETLRDIIGGMKLSAEGKSLAESILDEVKSRLPDVKFALGKEEEEHFGNMLREIDLVLLESTAMLILANRILFSVDRSAREKFKDRKISVRGPIENFISIS